MKLYYVYVLFFIAGRVCPQSWEGFSGSCYKLFSSTLNWNASKYTCESLGTRLAVLNSKAEWDVVSLYVAHRSWIGLHMDPANKSRWLWVDETECRTCPYLYYWSDDKKVFHDPTQQCVEILPGRSWNDTTCGTSLHYLCEIGRKFSFCFAWLVLFIKNRYFNIYFNYTPFSSCRYEAHFPPSLLHCQYGFDQFLLTSVYIR